MGPGGRVVSEGWVRSILAGDFAVDDPIAACIRILVAIDGVGAYVNNVWSFDYEAFTRFVSDVA